MDTTDAPQIIEHIHKSLTFTAYLTRWVPCSARFVVAGISPKAKGIMQVYELDRGDLKLVDEREKPAGIKCATFGASSLEDRHMVGHNSMLQSFYLGQYYLHCQSVRPYVIDC
jgi:WD repeat-containing protein 92